MTVLTVELPTETGGAELVIALDGQVVQASGLDLATSAGSAHAHVSTLLASGTFGDEVVGADDHLARRYGFELWTWLTSQLDQVAVDRFVTGTGSVVQICGPPSLQALHWELLNAAPISQPARWVAETIAIRRVLSNACLPKRESQLADRRVGDVVIVSARPYLDEDIGADRPVRRIGETLGTSATFRWLPGARRETLRRAANDLVRPWLLHLDMHGVRATKVVSAIGGAMMVPHLLLESERGADPVTVAELLRLIGGEPPRHLLLTSCESDATDVGAPDGFAEQALGHGVESVVMARRRLTPNEVEILSEVVHGSVADGASIDQALLRARRSLISAARSPNETAGRIGGFAWAAFTHYAAPGAEAGGAAGSSPHGRQASSQVPVPPLPSAISDGVVNRRIAVVQVDDRDHAATLIDGLAWWAARLAGNFRFQRPAPPSNASEAVEALSPPADLHPVVRFHDWLALTAPQRLLPNAEDLRWAISPAMLDHATPAVTVDVIVVGCAHSHVVGPLSDPRLTTSSLRRFSDSSGSLDGAGALTRWLAGVDERLAPGWSLLAQDDIPDPAYDSLLASMVSAAGGDEQQLWAGLTSCSAGLLRRHGHRVDVFEAAFEGLSRFADIAFDVGLAVRTDAGRWLLDRYHPRLAAAIQRAALHRSARNPGPWLDWEFRVAATAKELTYDPDGFLPDYRTLSGRLAWPDVALGPALAETTDRNYVAYAIARLADSTPPSTWHGPVSPGDQVQQVFDQINQRRQAEEQRRRDAQPAPKPSAQITTLTGSPVRPDLVGALQHAFVDLKEQSRADLASALLTNGPIPGLGVLQPREIALNAIGDSFLVSDEPPAREILHRLSQDFAWAEDRAHLFLDAGVMFTRRGYTQQGAAFLDTALQLNMSAEGEHPAGHCVEILTMRARRHREAGRLVEWRRDVHLAERFMLTNPWWTFTIHVTSLIAELRAAGQVADRLRLTAHLMRSYQTADSPPRWLTQERARSLAEAGRTTEAVELLRAIDTDELAPRTRSIIELEIAQCVQDVDPPGAFDLYLRVATYATDTVLATALDRAGRVRHRTGHETGASDVQDEALELLRRAALTPGGGLASMEACVELSWQLLFGRHGEEALGWIDRVGAIDKFPVLTQVAALRAGALLRLDRPDEEIRPLLLTAWWGHSGRTWVRMRAIFEQEGHSRVLSESWHESMELQRRWILEGEPAPPAGIDLTPLAFAVHRRTVAFSEPFDHREFNDQRLENLTTAVLGDWSAWSRLANDLWDRGRLPEALIYFDMCRIGLESHGAMSFDERVRSALTSSLYSLAVLCRRTGDRANALKWGSLLIQRLEGLTATSADQRTRANVDQLSRVYQLVGNLHYDSGNFMVSLTFHAQALAAECSVSADEIDVDSLIEASSSAPEAWQAVHALCNVGNSLRALGRDSSFSRARYRAVILAGELQDLETRARQSDEAFVLDSIQQGFVRDVPRQVPLGRALHAIRSALANAGP